MKIENLIYNSNLWDKEVYLVSKKIKMNLGEMYS